MSQFNKEILSALVQHQDLDEIFRHYLEIAMNQLLQNELAAFLGYEAYAREGFNSGNSRNGYYLRTFKTQYGELNLTIPRDRNGEFSNHTLPAYQRQTDRLEQTVIQLYQKGVTTREIAELMEKMYGAYYSPQTVSNLTKVVDEQVQAFKQRQLSIQYAIVYLDATYLPLRRDSVAKEAIHLAIGIQENGHKEVLGYQIAPTESSEIWFDLLSDLKSRGLEQVLLFVADGLSGFNTAIERTFPKSQIQQCLVHVSRNLEHHVRVKDRSEVIGDFKQIHRAPTKMSAIHSLVNFIDRWQSKYPKLTKQLMTNDYLLTCFNFPLAIRASIYSTNLIEAFNKKLKRQTKKKEQFPNEASLERFLVSIIMDYNERFSNRVHKGFNQVEDTLASMFD